MSINIGPPVTTVTPGAGTASNGRDAKRLLESARQLEGLFVRQLFAAMRETIPEDGMLSGGAGEEMFTAMLDEHLADAVPAQWSRGLAAQLARQLAAESPSATPEK